MMLLENSRLSSSSTLKPFLNQDKLELSRNHLEMDKPSSWQEIDYDAIVSRQADGQGIGDPELPWKNQMDINNLRTVQKIEANDAIPDFFQLSWEDMPCDTDPETGDRSYVVQSGKYDEMGRLNESSGLLMQHPYPANAIIKVCNPDGTSVVYKTDQAERICSVSKKNERDEQDETREGLTEEEKQQIKEETGWSDEIINHIESMEQYEIYKKAGLHEEVVNGKHCLVKDIDWDYVDPKKGKSNRELAAEGKPPIDPKTGERIELHHMGQDKNGPFAELSENSEHGDGNHGTLHPKNEESWRHEPGAKAKYEQERAAHWKSRAEGGN